MEVSMNILKDLINTKQIHEKIIRVAEREKTHFADMFCPSGYSSGSSYVDADTIHGSKTKVELTFVYEEISRLDNLIYLEKEIIKQTEDEIREIEIALEDIGGMELKVKQMQIIQGNRLKKLQKN